ncbi:MAG: hypothetical protein ACI9HK_001412, partial [Pirellulaceae bacterium]
MFRQPTIFVMGLIFLTLVACRPPAPNAGSPNDTGGGNGTGPRNTVATEPDPTILDPTIARPDKSGETASEPIVREPVELGVRDTLTQLQPIARGAASVYSDDGSMFASAPADVLIFDVATRRVVKRLHVGDYPVIALDFSADGEMLAAGMWSFEGDENEFRAFHIHVFELPSGKEISRIEAAHADQNTRRRVRISPDKTKVAASNAAGISVYEIETGEVSWEFAKDGTANPNQSYAAFDVTPDWKYFLFDLQRISYPEKETLRAVKYNDQERPFFWDNLISADGKFAVALGGENGTEQKMFELKDGTLKAAVDGVPSRGIAVSRDFRKVVNAHGYWNTSDSSIVKAASRPNPNHEWMAVSPDGLEATINSEYLRLTEERGERTLWGQNPYFGSTGVAGRFVRGELVVSAGGGGRVINLKDGKLGREESMRDPKVRDYRTKFGPYPSATSPRRDRKIDGKGEVAMGNSKSSIFDSAAGKRPARGQPHFVS